MTRKLLFAIFTLLFASTNAEGQIKWEVGMAWEYEAYGFIQVDFTKTKFTLAKDTIVENKNCLILESENYSCTQRPIRDIVYQDGHKIFYYHQQDSTFQLLYDFNSEIGDTLKIRLWEGHDSNYDFVYFIVDSIELIQYSNLTLKKFTLRAGILVEGEILFYPNFYEIIEGIGCTANLFYFHDNGLCDGLYVENIICFSHPTFGAYILDPLQCELTTSVNENLNAGESIQIYPNPAQNLIQIETMRDFSYLEIYSITGKTIYRDKFREMIDISSFENGLYYIKLLSDQFSYSTSFSKY